MVGVYGLVEMKECGSGMVGDLEDGRSRDEHGIAYWVDHVLKVAGFPTCV